MYIGEGNHSDIIDLTFIQSGSYSDLNLDLNEGEELEISDLDYPIEMTVSCTAEDIQNYDCYFYDDTLEDWIDDCELTFANGTICVIKTTHASEFQIAEIQSG